MLRRFQYAIYNANRFVIDLGILADWARIYNGDTQPVMANPCIIAIMVILLR